MKEEILTLSRKEPTRPETVRRAAGKRLRRKEAACQLASGIRRIKRLVRRYREQCPAPGRFTPVRRVAVEGVLGAFMPGLCQNNKAPCW